MTTREGETMNLNDPNSIRETVFAIARDGARPHIKAGIIQRLRELERDILHDGDCSFSYSQRLAAEIAALEDL